MLYVAILLSLLVLMLAVIVAVANYFNWKIAKIITGGLMSVSALAAMILYLSALQESGGADDGQEFVQLYLPILVYAFFIVSGVMLLLRKKQRKR